MLYVFDGSKRAVVWLEAYSIFEDGFNIGLFTP